MSLSEHQKAILLDDFEVSCENWYGIYQADTERENLECNYLGRQELTKHLRVWSGNSIKESIRDYRLIQDDINKTEIRICQQYHECMPPIRGLYPPTKELRQWIEEKGYD